MAITGKTALVTGAGSGIGRAVALALQSAGYSVALAGRRAAELEKTAALANPNGGRMLSIPTDIGKPESVRALFARTMSVSDYRTALAIFDRQDPRKVLFRSDKPIFEPEKEWEKIGQVPNVVFVEGMAKKGNRYLFYYGAADKYVGVAEASVN